MYIDKYVCTVNVRTDYYTYMCARIRMYTYCKDGRFGSFNFVHINPGTYVESDVSINKN